MKSKVFYTVNICVILGGLLISLFSGCAGTGNHESHDHEIAGTEKGRTEPVREKQEHAGRADSFGLNEQAGFMAVSPGEMKEWKIKTGFAQQRIYSEKIELTGVVQDNRESTVLVSSRVKGVVTALLRDQGDKVRVGEPLCVVSSLELLDLKKKYLQGFQRFLRSRKNYARAEKLAEAGALEKKELLRRESEYKFSLTEYLAMESGLKAVGLSGAAIDSVQEALNAGNLKKIRKFLTPLIRIPAPRTGRIVERKLFPGQTIHGDQPLFKIADLKKMWIILDAAEKNLPAIFPGKAVAVLARDVSEKPFAGKVLLISDVVDPVLRTIKVRCSVDNSDLKLKTGMFVRGLIRSGRSVRELALPGDAVIRMNGVDGVFVTEHGGVRFLPVRITATDSQGYVFVRGITKKDELAVKGSFRLKAAFNARRSGADPHAGHGH